MAAKAFLETVDVASRLILHFYDDPPLCGRLLSPNLPPPPEFTIPDALDPSHYSFDPSNPKDFLEIFPDLGGTLMQALGQAAGDAEELIQYLEDVLLSLLGFNDRASSVRWYAPEGLGVEIVLHTQAHGGGGTLILPRTESPDSIAHLSDELLTGASGNANDRIRSIRFEGQFTPATIVSYSWHTSLPHTPEPFVFHDGDTATPILDASGGDGPMTVDIELLVRDSLSGEGSATASVTVNNVPPTVNAGQDQVIYEGDVLTLDPFTFTDPGTLDTHTAEIDWGDGSPKEPGTVAQSPGSGTVSGSHVYADDGVYTVEVCVQDDDMVEFDVPAICDTMTVTVDNVAPTVNAGADQVIYEGDVLTPVTFNDKGTLDTHTATVDWGDGSLSEDAVVYESPFGPPGSTAGADGTIAANQHVLPPGDYTVTVCVTDDDAAETCDSLNVTVVHGFLRFCAYADDGESKIEKEAVADCALVPSGVPGDPDDQRPSGVGSRGKVDIKEKVTIQGILLSLTDKIDVDKDARVYGTLTAGCG